MGAPATSKRSGTAPVVLCVSEDKAFLNAARLGLGQAGFVVVTSANPQEALELSASQDLDAVICDYGLSQQDGVSFYEQLRDERGSKTPPALFVNDAFAAPLHARCLAAGASGLHSKSDPPGTLVERTIEMIADGEKRRAVEGKASRRAPNGATDPLTRVANREHFQRRLSAESFASYRDGNHFSVVIVSVDRWDRVVERFGDQRAENLLAQAARLVEGELRSRDCVGRHSEHAFGIVLPETPREAASAVASRLRRTFAATEFGDLDHPIGITVSAGVAARPIGVRMAPEALLEQALRNCAAAQARGGDRVIADSELTGNPIALLLGNEADEDTAALHRSLARRGLEVRRAATADEARAIMADLPAALIAALHPTRGGDAVELLVWARDRFPAAKRVLAPLTTADPQLMTRAVNDAAIDYLLLRPWDGDRIDTLVDELVFC